jgi:hypothetical protein
MSAINRSLLASAAASVMSTASTVSTASATSRKGALCSPEGVSLDAYVRRAWSSLNNDVVSVAPEAIAFGHRADKNTDTKNTDTEAGGEATAVFVADAYVDNEAVTGAVLESDRKENINTGSDVDKGALLNANANANATAAVFECYVPKAPELKSPAVDAERPIKHKERGAAATDRVDEGVQILPLMPLQALIPPRPENIEMGLQIGKGFSKTPSVGASAVPKTKASAPASRAGLDVIPQFSRGVKPISKTPPAVETVSAVMPVQIPKSGKIDTKSLSPDTDAVSGEVALSTDAASKSTQRPVERPTQTSTKTATQQLPAHSADRPRKEKSLPRIGSDASVPPLPLIQAMQEQTATAAPNPAAASQDSARHSPQPMQQPATAPTASTEAAASATTGSTLTYRFDKWNGNHAVTVHAPLHADGRSRDLEPASRNTAPQTVQNAEKIAAQNTAQSNTRYSLSPSDDLVSQRLSEHLARTADEQDRPSMRLTDSDERQRRQGQGQAQQEDEEDET